MASEASSIAGRQALGNLIVFYDHNEISIEDDTNIALSEDVALRYEAYGWHVQKVEGGENVVGILEAIEAAKAVTDRPSFIQLRTIIGYPAPNLMNTGKAHGAALGDDEVAAVKKILGFDPNAFFEVDDVVIKHTRQALDRGQAAKAEWDKSFHAWAEANPERKELFDRMIARRLPDGWTDVLPSWEPDPKGIATRAASGKVLSALGPVLPELWGGSADLAESNNTTMAGADSFGPVAAKTKHWDAQPYGRTLHFGIREHAMGAILSGIVMHGPTRPYGGTFLTFSDYMRGAVRLAAVMGAPAIYVWTHDSIGLGEDGPTHQPIEHLAALRAIPGLSIVRPADANETAYAWRAILERQHDWFCGPVGLCLTRQAVPVLEGTDYEGVHQGRVRARRSRWGSAGHSAGDRLRGADRGAGAGGVAGRGHRHPRGVRAVPGLVRGAGRGVHRRDPAAGRHRAGVHRGRDRAAVVALARRARPARVPRTLRRLRRLQDPIQGVRHHQ